VVSWRSSTSLALSLSFWLGQVDFQSTGNSARRLNSGRLTLYKVGMALRVVRTCEVENFA
jgi:hypothetical protein